MLKIVITYHYENITRTILLPQLCESHCQNERDGSQGNRTSSLLPAKSSASSVHQSRAESGIVH